MTDPKQLSRDLVRAVNDRDYGRLDTLVSPALSAPPIVVDAPADSFRAGIEMAVASFPDLRLAVDDAIGDGDRVALRVRISATSTGAYRRGAATGRGGEWPAVFVLRWSDGRLVEFGGVSDRFGALQQLGLIGSDDEIAAVPADPGPDDPRRYVSVLVRRLPADQTPEAGYAAFRDAWRQEIPYGRSVRVHTGRSLADPREILTYAQIAATPAQFAELAERSRPSDTDRGERVREAIGDTITTGVYEIIATDDLS